MTVQPCEQLRQIAHASHGIRLTGERHHDRREGRDHGKERDRGNYLRKNRAFTQRQLKRAGQRIVHFGDLVVVGNACGQQQVDERRDKQRNQRGNIAPQDAGFGVFHLLRLHNGAIYREVEPHGKGNGCGHAG